MNILQEGLVSQEIMADEQVLVRTTYVETGDFVKVGAELVELETSKVAVIMEAETDGYVEMFCKSGDELAVGTLVFYIYDVPPQEKIEDRELDKVSIVSPDLNPLFSKRAEMEMVKRGLDKADFKGKDFVTYRDVAGEPEEPTVAHAPPQQNKIKDSLPPDEDVTLMPLSMSKRTEIRSLSNVQIHGLTSAVTAFVDSGRIFQFLQVRSDLFKTSILPLVAYECSRLLREFPELNSCFGEDHILCYKDVHLGLAMDMGNGLKVVKVANADTLSYTDIEADIEALIIKYLDGTLTLAETTGTTFTITDLSGYGAFHFQPLINMRQSAILGIGAHDPALNRSLLTLTFDHRVTEGRLAAQFLLKLVERLERYSLKMLQDEQKAKALQDVTCSVCQKSLMEDKALGGAGFISVVDHNGLTRLMCRICFEGWE